MSNCQTSDEFRELVKSIGHRAVTEKTGASRHAYYSWVSGRRNPSAPNMLRLLKMLPTPVNPYR